jgi:hypothetical protein
LISISNSLKEQRDATLGHTGSIQENLLSIEKEEQSSKNSEILETGKLLNATIYV